MVKSKERDRVLVCVSATSGRCWGGNFFDEDEVNEDEEKKGRGSGGYRGNHAR